MKIFDEIQNKSLSTITILLTKKEAAQLHSYLEQLIRETEPNEHVHFHLENEDFSKEITIALYDKNGNLESFSERYRKLILTDI